MFNVTRLSTSDLRAERDATADEMRQYTETDLHSPTYQRTLTRLERCDAELRTRTLSTRRAA